MKAYGTMHKHRAAKNGIARGGKKVTSQSLPNDSGIDAKRVLAELSRGVPGAITLSTLSRRFGISQEQLRPLLEGLVAANRVKALSATTFVRRRNLPAGPVRKSHPRRKPSITPTKPARAALPPAREENIHDLARRVLLKPIEWLDAPNPNLAGRRPNDLLGTTEEAKVAAILNAVDWGMF